jgi:hypothetical protein
MSLSSPDVITLLLPSFSGTGTISLDEYISTTPSGGLVASGAWEASSATLTLTMGEGIFEVPRERGRG